MTTILQRILPMRLLAFVLLAGSCQTSVTKRPGLCLSFDDRSVKEWYDMRSLLANYGAHVTFFVSKFDSLTPEEIEMLRELESEGHEIASHGSMHIVSERYIKDHSYEEYIANEIDASISAMTRLGFQPKSFAYPYGAKYWFTDRLLLQKFDIVRGVAQANADGDLTQMDNIYYAFDGDRAVSALGIDRGTRLTETMIKGAIRRAIDKHEVLQLYGHSPGSPDQGPYTFDLELLTFILQEARNNNLLFMRYEDLSKN